MSPLQPSGDLDLLFAEYAAGALPPAAAVLVRSQLEMSPRNRAWVRDLNVLGGLLLDESFAHQAGGRPPDPAVRPDDPSGATGSPCGGSILPASLQRFCGFTDNEIKWAFRLPGLRECPIENSDHGHASLLKISPGVAVPSHTHGGREITLVLQGGFSDGTGHFLRGDIAIADGEIDHRPRADDGEDCICFAVSEAPMRLTGPIGRLLGRLAGN